MHPRLIEIFTYLDEQHAAFRGLFDSIPAARRSVAPAPGRWSPIEIVDHCATVNGLIATLIAREIAKAREAGLGPETDTGPILSSLQVERVVDRTHRVNAPAMLVPHAHDEGGLWEKYARADAAVRAAALTGDGLALGAVSLPHPALGPLTMYQWIAFAGSHTARHAAQMAECAAA